MSDTVTANAGTGGAVFATDDNSGVHYPYTKLVWGPDNTFNIVDVASGKPIPFQLRTSLGVEVPFPAALAANGGLKIEGVASGVAVPVSLAVATADPFGLNADAASASGSISAKLRAIATALGITAFDLGSGTGGTRTLRWFLDTAQWIGGAGAVTSATQRVTLPSDDPAVTVLGAVADAASSTTGSLSAKLRSIAANCALFVFGAGTAAAAERVTLASDDPAVAVLGATTGAKVVTDANGTIQQYARGIVVTLINALGAGLATTALRMVTTIEYVASSAMTITIASLATSATWVAGRASTAYDNTTNKYPAVAVSGVVMTGTSPTVGEIQVWLIPILDDTNWPDSVTGTDAAKTFTTAPILASCGVMIGRMVNTTTSNVAYPFRCANIVSLLGFMPKKFVVFVTHSTVAALNATGGSHFVNVTPVYM